MEKHLHASVEAVRAENRELQEVQTAASHNRTALDLLLPLQGDTCEVIGAECCSYVSDAAAEVLDVVHHTA